MEIFNLIKSICNLKSSYCQKSLCLSADSVPFLPDLTWSENTLVGVA